MADDFSSSVAYGLKLSKRIYYGKDAALAPPKPEAMEAPACCLPTAPMVYAVVSDPSIVDNPDVPSYQPYVYGRCDPPALVPLHMHAIAMEVDCFLDTAFVTVSGTWRLHCIMAGKSCDCRVAIPVGEQGSVLGLEIDVGGRSYHTQLITLEDARDSEKVVKAKDGLLLRRQIYTLKVAQVEGGTNLFIKVNWSQKLLYQEGQFCLSLPFSFPAYVKPIGRKISKREKIVLNVNPGIGSDVLYRASSHPLKEVRHQFGKLGAIYEAEVSKWSNADFYFSYDVSSRDIFGGLLLQSPSLHDVDQREMFCLYLFPSNSLNRKVFRKEVVFVVDASGSMQDSPLENARSALLAALSNLNPVDSFNIITFNEGTRLFSSSMELATKEATENATHWIGRNFIAEGGTNIMLPLDQALEMLTKTCDAIPLIFLITDGAVEDERHICDAVKSRIACRRPICPRIYTFGIGSYCNHYFLQMLAQIGKGYYDAAFDADLIGSQMQRLFETASSITFANINVDTLEDLDSLELYPNHIPDLSSASPLVVSGRYCGKFPHHLKASGLLPDMSDFSLDLKVQQPKGIPLDRVVARRQIDILTSHAWFSQDKQLEEKSIWKFAQHVSSTMLFTFGGYGHGMVAASMLPGSQRSTSFLRHNNCRQMRIGTRSTVAKISIQSGVPSEYSHMILVQTDKVKQDSDSVSTEEKLADKNDQKIIFLRNLGLGFGNLVATAENLPPFQKEKLHESSEIIAKAAARCCGRLLDRCCCMCFLQTCSRLSDRCAVTFTQLCTALACFECFNCCFELCCNSDLC